MAPGSCGSAEFSQARSGAPAWPVCIVKAPSAIAPGLMVYAGTHCRIGLGAVGQIAAVHCWFVGGGKNSSVPALAMQELG